MNDKNVIEYKEWIIPCNPSFKLEAALKTLKIIDWKQSKIMKSANVGDLVYIYMSSPQKEIRYKGAILAVDKYDDFIDDLDFSEGQIQPEGPCFSIAVFREYSVEKITYAKLKENGLNYKLNGPAIVKGEVSKFLHKCDIQQKIKDEEDGIISDACLLPFPVDIEEKLYDAYSDDVQEDCFSDDDKIHARELSLDQLREKANKQSRNEIREKVTRTVIIERDPYIAAYAKRKANGICQLCGKEAPFNTPDGEPYLESHHIIWLSKGGKDSVENTIALCPNCHKKMHVVNDPGDVALLLQRALANNE